jgi:hypothetical protein
MIAFGFGRAASVDAGMPASFRHRPRARLECAAGDLGRLSKPLQARERRLWDIAARTP